MCIIQDEILGSTKEIDVRKSWSPFWERNMNNMWPAATTFETTSLATVSNLPTSHASVKRSYSHTCCSQTDKNKILPIQFWAQKTSLLQKWQKLHPSKICTYSTRIRYDILYISFPYMTNSVRRFLWLTYIDTCYYSSLFYQNYFTACAFHLVIIKFGDLGFCQTKTIIIIHAIQASI